MYKKPGTFFKTEMQSFAYAINGLRLFFRERHAVIHAIAAVLVLIAAFAFQLRKEEFIAILLCIGLVFTAELFNSTIEILCNFVSPEKHEQIKQIKDIAAGAVLVSALIAAIVGVLIFFPYVLQLFGQIGVV